MPSPVRSLRSADSLRESINYALQYDLTRHLRQGLPVFTITQKTKRPEGDGGGGEGMGEGDRGN